MKKYTLIITVYLFSHTLLAQNQGLKPPFSGFDNLVIMTDSLIFDTKQDVLSKNRKQYLFFEFSENEQVIRGELFLKPDFGYKISLLNAQDFNVLDSLELINDEFYRFRIRFKDISDNPFPSLTFLLEDSVGKQSKHEILLFPYTRTRATFYTDNDDLYLGEPKRFEIVTNNVDNLVLDGEWKKQGDYEYRLYKERNQAFLQVLSAKRGRNTLEIRMRTKIPNLDSLGNVQYDLPVISRELNTRQSRLTFLRMDLRMITIDLDDREGYEIQLDNNRNLQIGKTYRVEDAEQKGSPLIAEIYTKQLLSNDKVLCIVRPYRTHLAADGYMYIKDGDTPLFITNVDITPRATIKKISILRNGGDWTSNLNIKPGEIIDLRLEGESLSKARYFFEDLEDISADTLTRSDVVANYRLKVPVNISKSSLEIYNRNKKTGHRLNVVEHQKPRPFDFIYVNYGAGPKRAETLVQPILYGETIKDLVISFDRNKIDHGDILYGRQFITIRIRIEDKNGTLIETRTLGNFEICPGEASPRHAFYREAGCRLDDILINSYLSRKTHSLDEWSKIELTIETQDGKYGGEGYNQRIVIYRKRAITYDLDVSFPAGLITRRIGSDERLSGFGGISLALIAQFNFFKEGEIQKMLPFKVGGGVLAQNAFNFRDEAERDLGLVVLGSFHPLRKGRYSFPLYLGAGYFLQADQFFFLVGPGIQVNF